MAIIQFSVPYKRGHSLCLPAPLLRFTGVCWSFTYFLSLGSGPLSLGHIAIQTSILMFVHACKHTSKQPESFVLLPMRHELFFLRDLAAAFSLPLEFLNTKIW